MARHCQASHGHQAIRGWPGPSADGLGPRLAPNSKCIGLDVDLVNIDAVFKVSSEDRLVI